MRRGVLFVRAGVFGKARARWRKRKGVRRRFIMNFFFFFFAVLCEDQVDVVMDTGGRREISSRPLLVKFATEVPKQVFCYPCPTERKTLQQNKQKVENEEYLRCLYRPFRP